MSVSLMSLAFKAPIPSTRKLVLLALCDAANDQGECYPSVTALVEKCSLSERAIQGAIADLEADGCLRREFRKGRSTVYWMTPDRANPRSRCTPAAGAPPQQVHHTPAPAAPLPPQQVHPTPAAGAPRTINEPSEDKKKERARRRATPPDRPNGVDEQVWADWLAMRAEKRATVSQTVIAGAVTEAEKAGMTLEAFLRVWVLRGSQGLMAAWLKDSERRQTPDAEPAWRTEQRARAAEFAGPAAAKRPVATTTMEIVDVAARRVG